MSEQFISILYGICTCVTATSVCAAGFQVQGSKTPRVPAKLTACYSVLNLLHNGPDRTLHQTRQCGKPTAAHVGMATGTNHDVTVEPVAHQTGQKASSYILLIKGYGHYQG